MSRWAGEHIYHPRLPAILWSETWMTAGGRAVFWVYADSVLSCCCSEFKLLSTTVKPNQVIWTLFWRAGRELPVPPKPSGGADDCYDVVFKEKFIVILSTYHKPQTANQSTPTPDLWPPTPDLWPLTLMSLSRTADCFKSCRTSESFCLFVYFTDLFTGNTPSCPRW